MARGIDVSASSNNFTAIRAALALGVLLSHSYGLLGQPEPALLGRTLGNFAVHSFFALSGYLIVGSYIGTPSFVGFVVKRFLRLTPALLVALLLTSALAGTAGHFRTNPVPHIANGSIWTLSWEVLAYAAVAALGVFGLLNRVCLGALLAVALFAYAARVPSVANTTLGPLFIMFLGGAFLRTSEGELNIKVVGGVLGAGLIALYIPAVFGVAGSALGAVPFVYGPDFSLEQARELFYLAALPGALLLACRYAPISIPIASDYSYGIYVFAWPVQQTFIYLGWCSSPWGLFLLAGAATCLLAAVSWHCIEKPSMSVMRRTRPVAV